jgi:nicotinamidase-related amidase
MLIVKCYKERDYVLLDAVLSKDKKRNIVDEWESVKAPPPPELKRIALEPKTTALLVLDIQNQNCNAERRPRCVASVPRIVGLLSRAREAGMYVAYSLTRSAESSDIRVEVASQEGEQVVKSGVDKFYNTNLEDILRDRGVKTVIIVGTSSNGAVLHTATGAAARGFEIIVPVDGMSASDPYAEQYTAWHLANAPGTRRRTTLTRTDLIDF